MASGLPSKVVVLAPHCDDEGLGCSEVIQYYHQVLKIPVVVVFTTDSGGTPEWRAAHPEYGPTRNRFARRYLLSGTVYGSGPLASEVRTLTDVPDGVSMDYTTKLSVITYDLAKSGLIDRKTMLWTCGNAPRYVHPDHLATFNAARALARKNGIGCYVYACDGEPGVTPGGPDPSQRSLAAKRAVLSAYRSFFLSNYPMKYPKASFDMEAVRHDVIGRLLKV